MEVRLARVGKYNRIPLMITRSGTDRSISSTFYKQLLHLKILNAQKDSQVGSVVWHFWDLQA